MEFTYKLSEPEKILTFHGDAVVGITATILPVITSEGITRQQILTAARYGWGEFWAYDVKVESNKDVPTLEKRLIVSNSPLASWRGEAISAQLWNEHQPRAQVAQVSNDGKELLYLNNGGRSIGRIQLPSPASDVKPGVVKPALAGIVGDRAEYFLQLWDGTLAVIENYDDCMLRLYAPNGNNLKLTRETKLGGSLFYGLAQDNDDEIMMVVPKKGNYPLESNKEPGVYRTSVIGVSDTLQKDPLFEAITLPEDLRGLAPVFSKGVLHGYLMSTYRATRDSLNGGEPSELFYTRVLNK